MKEQWKLVRAYNGGYAVSNIGRIWSFHSGKIIKTRLNNHGYPVVRLSNNGKRKMEYVHRLVAIEFVDNPNKFPVVNHKDENPLNSAASNLEWCTLSYNQNYGNCIKKKQDSLARSGILRPVIAESLADGDRIIFPSIADAVRNGFHKYSIYQCCNGKRGRHRGYTWKYADMIQNKGGDSMGFRAARKAAKLTALQAARALGVSQQTIFNWEGGSVLPEARRLPDIARLYSCTVDDLLSKNIPAG